MSFSGNLILSVKSFCPLKLHKAKDDKRIEHVE